MNMDTSLIPCYASVLLWINVFGATVPPPSNVTLRCHNMQNTLSWVYDDSEDGLRFKVFIGSQAMESQDLWVDAPKMSIDLSKFSDPDNDNVVMVYAVKDGVESAPEPEEGIVYSYFKDSPALLKCTLDLPSVNLITLDENHLHFSFTHPGVLYPTSQGTRQRKSPKSQDSLPEFEYHIDVVNQSQSHKYSCSEKECQGRLRVHGSEKSYCLNISGEMKKMSVQATRMYCSEPPKPPGINPVAYIIPIVLVLGGAIVIGAMVFVKKTRHGLSTSVPVPEVLDFSATNNHHQQNYAALDNSDYAVAEFEPSSPAPLLQNQDTSNDSSTFRDEVRLPLGVPDDDNENAPQEGAQAPQGAQGAQEDGYTQGSSLDKDEEEEEGEEEQTCSAYERRDKLGPN